MKNFKLIEKGVTEHLFGPFVKSLGAIGSLLGHFWKPLGHLGHQKSPNGAPKAPKGVPGVTKKGAFLEHVARKGPKKRSLGYSPDSVLTD